MSDPRLMLNVSCYLLLEAEYEKLENKKSKKSIELKEKMDKIYSGLDDFEIELVKKKV